MAADHAQGRRDAEETGRPRGESALSARSNLNLAAHIQRPKGTLTKQGRGPLVMQYSSETGPQTGLPFSKKCLEKGKICVLVLCHGILVLPVCRCEGNEKPQFLSDIAGGDGEREAALLRRVVPLSAGRSGRRRCRSRARRRGLPRRGGRLSRRVRPDERRGGDRIAPPTAHPPRPADVAPEPTFRRRRQRRHRVRRCRSERDAVLL